jgi:Phage integrase, N-terminal SAM-like domain
MNDLDAAAPISPLRQRSIDDMTMRRFSRETQRNYIRDVGRFATFMGRSPGTATAEDLRRFQVEQREAGVPVPTMNGIVSALRFFFHAHARPSRPLPQAGSGHPSAQAAGGPEPRRGRPLARLYPRIHSDCLRSNLQLPCRDRLTAPSDRFRASASDTSQGCPRAYWHEPFLKTP